MMRMYPRRKSKTSRLPREPSALGSGAIRPARVVCFSSSQASAMRADEAYLSRSAVSPLSLPSPPTPERPRCLLLGEPPLPFNSSASPTSPDHAECQEDGKTRDAPMLNSSLKALHRARVRAVLPEPTGLCGVVRCAGWDDS